MLIRSLTIVALALGLFACSKTADMPQGAPKTPAPAPAEARHFYRFDFTLEVNEPGKPTQSNAYTMNLEDHGTGEILMGKNVPLTLAAAPANDSPAPALIRGAAPRTDVGFKLRCNVDDVGDDLRLRSNVEVSDIGEGHSIQKVSLLGETLVSPGKKVLVSTAEDPGTHRRYNLWVLATKLR